MTTKPSLSPRALGAIALVVSVAVIATIFSNLFRKPFEPGYRTVAANFQRAPQLNPGDQVRLEGNVEGKVDKIESGPDARQVRVIMKVEKDAGPIYADARGRLGFKTLLGGVFYIDLDRGSREAGPLGGKVIPMRNTSVQAEIEDVTDIFRGEAVKGFQTLPGQLATGLSKPRETAQTFRTLGDIAPDAKTGLEAFRGRVPGTDLPAVIDATARTVKALDTDRDEIRTLVSGAAATLQVTGRRSAEIRQTLDALPDVTLDMTSTFARLDRTLGIADRLVGKLIPAAPQVAPTLAALRPTLGKTQRLLTTAGPLTPVLTGFLGDVGTAAGQLTPLVAELKPSLKKVDATILPYLAREDPQTGKSTTVMIGGFLSGFGGSAAQQDGNGHFIRFPASGSADSAYIPCKSSFAQADSASLLACDNFNEAFSKYLDYLPKLDGGRSASAGRERSGG